MLLACLPWLRERQQFTAASTELPTRAAALQPAACSHGVTADPLPAQRWSAEGGPRQRPRNSSDALLSPGCHGAASSVSSLGECSHHCRSCKGLSWQPFMTPLGCNVSQGGIQQ